MQSTLQERAYKEILEKITDHTITPGSRIREGHVAKELGMSTTPVREAFRKLEREGWIMNIPQSGCRIPVYGKNDMEELFVLRASIESVPLALVIKRATENDWQVITEAADRYEKECEICLNQYSNECNKDKRIKSPVKSDVDFHCAILNAAHSNRISQLVKALALQSRCMQIDPGHVVAIEAIKNSCEEHRALYIALKNGQLRLAEELARAHVLGAWSRVAPLLSTEGEE